MKVLLSKQIFFFVMIINAASYSTAETLPEPALEDCKRISPSIVLDLSDFAQLIDKVVFDAIVAEHYLLDKDFRKAFEYVKTKDFFDTMNKLQNIPEVRDILSWLEILIPCSAKDLNVPKFEFILLDAMMNEEKLRYRRQRRSIEKPESLTPLSSEPIPNLNSFTSFVRELLHELPRTRFINLIKIKCEKNSQFKTFYKNLRKPSFKTKVEEAMKTSNFESYMKKLNSHGIDIQSLAPILFELVSWGPVIQ